MSHGKSAGAVRSAIHSHTDMTQVPSRASYVLSVMSVSRETSGSKSTATRTVSRTSGASRQPMIRAARRSACESVTYLLESHHNALGRRRVGRLGDRVQRHEHVGLREVRRRTTACGVELDHPELLRPTLDSVLPFADDVDDLPVDESERAYVVGVHEDDSASGRDPAIAVV